MSEETPENPGGTSDVDVIARNLECPACGYNLRGLHGSVVHCPECGHNCDVAQLVSAGWTKPWYKAPKFNVVLAPAAVAMLGFMFGTCLGPSMLWFGAGGLRWEELMIALAIALPVVAGWGVLMWLSWGVFEDSRGIWLSLLAHVLVVGLFVGVVGCVATALGGLALLIDAATNGGITETIMLAVCVGLLPIFVVIAWASRRGERYIAQQCIRRYLELQAKAD